MLSQVEARRRAYREGRYWDSASMKPSEEEIQQQMPKAWKAQAGQPAGTPAGEVLRNAS